MKDPTNAISRIYLSSWFMAPWMQMDGKLQSTSNLFRATARLTLETKMTTCVKAVHGKQCDIVRGRL